MRLVTLSVLAAANSAFAYPHSHSALYKRGAEPLGTLGVVLVATIGSILGVVLSMYLVMHVPSWYRNWRERRRTAQIMNALQRSVNASVTVLGGSEVASTITKFGTTPLGGSPAFVTPVLSRAASRDTHTQLHVSPLVSQITPILPLMSASPLEAQTTHIPSITVTPS